MAPTLYVWKLIKEIEFGKLHYKIEITNNGTEHKICSSFWYKFIIQNKKSRSVKSQQKDGALGLISCGHWF